jgi:hypothetical protein
MSNTSVCPCDIFEHPQVIVNPSGRSTLAYRAGTYLTFRHALLLSLPDEVELLNWRPSAKGDLALQMMEWWAYLADILTFYNERIANQDYLRTADLPESTQRLIRVLGYRPRPGIGATGTLAALMSGPKPFTLRQGFQIQSKPGPGKQPQVFELSADTVIQLPDSVSADPAPNPALLAADGSVLLQGTVTTVKAGDELLLLHKGWVGLDSNYTLAVVQSVAQEKDPRGNTNTRVKFTAHPSLPAGATATDYRLLKSTQSGHVWQYPAQAVPVIGYTHVDLESLSRGIKVRDPVLFTIPDASPSEQLVSVTSYTEAVWYANPAPPALDPRQPPTTPANVIPIPIPHSYIEFQPGLTSHSDSSSERATTLVRFAWQDVGTLIATASTAFTGVSPTLTAVPPATFPPGSNLPLLIEGANGNGEAGLGSVSSDGSTLQLSGLPSPPATLTPPLNVLFDLLSVSRGKTVANEILGSGDATVAGQEFVLQKSPLTYLLSPESTSGSNYSSTLQVSVNGVEWNEVPSFYGQPPEALIFVTREDEQNQTHVQFGDGVNGARVPSGVNNVVATYRYGSGAEAPDAGSLTVILQPQPGLKAIRNPVPVGGGADPDPPAQIKKYAPLSVLTFGRAVSGDDYATIAAQTPGVARSKADWRWDATQQRTLVTVYVGDDANAVAAAQTALAGAGDPNRPVVVKQARAISTSLSLTLVIDPTYVQETVLAAATAALIDPDSGLFGVNVIGIEQLIYESQIYQACLSVPGALAVHSLQFATWGEVESGFRFDPGTGAFFQIQPTNLTISPEVAVNAG